MKKAIKYSSKICIYLGKFLELKASESKSF